MKRVDGQSLSCPFCFGSLYRMIGKRAPKL
jgi:hypothetical protein